MTKNEQDFIIHAIMANPHARFFWDDRQNHMMMEVRHGTRCLFDPKVGIYEVYESAHVLSYRDNHGYVHNLIYMITVD